MRNRRQADDKPVSTGKPSPIELPPEGPIGPDDTNKNGPLTIMRLPLLATAILIALAPALADAAPTDPSKPRCTALLDEYGVKLGDDAQIQDRPNGCVMTDGAIETSSYQTWVFKRAEIEADNFAGIKKDMSTIPPWGRLAVEGLTWRFHTSSPVTNYITKLQQWPMDVTASYHWFPADGRFEVENIQVTSVRTGLISVSADLVTDKDTTPQALLASGHVGLSRLRLRLDNQGLFEALVGPMASASLLYFSKPGDDQPEIEPQVEGAKTKAIASLTATPDTQIDRESRRALIRLIEDIPHPTGFFSIEIEFAKPIMVSDLSLGADEAAIVKMIGTAKIKARYTAR